MTEILINEGELFHNVLQQETQKNITRITEIQNMAQILNTLFLNFSNAIANASRNIFKKLRYDEEEDPNIIFLSKFSVDLLNEIGKKINLITKKIKNQVIDPLEQFSQSQKNNYGLLRIRSGELYTQIQDNSAYLGELIKNFGSNSKTQELGEEDKAQFKQVYQNQMHKCNQDWMQIKQNYKKLLNDADSTNSFRCNFTIKMQVQVCHLLNKISGTQHIGEALSGYQQLSDQNQYLSVCIKQRIRDVMGKSMLLQQKQMEQLQGMKDFAFDEKAMIDDFITMFTSFSNMKEDQTKHEKARTLVLSNFNWATYFLNRLKANLHTQVKLTALKYHQITTIMKYLFATCAEEQKNEQIIYNIMYISYRMSHNGSYVIKQIGKHQAFWQNEKRWYQLIDYLIKVNEQKIKNARKLKNRQKLLKNVVKAGLVWMNWQPNLKINSEKTTKSQKGLSDAKIYEILCEMNYFMSRLEIKEKFIFDFIVEASTKYGISNQNKKKMLKFHYFNKQNGNAKQINPSYLKRKKHIEQKYRQTSWQKILIICVGKCLPFLAANKSLLTLRLVNKLWANQLKSKICKRFLILQKDYQFVNSIRLKIYCEYCPNILTETVFNKMIEQIPEKTQHSEIIKLDARRSLAWDQSLRETLVNVLKCFAFYHSKVGYLQGMNYLCENILKLSDEKFVVYKIFQYLMNNQFYGMYSANFDGLKIRIFQFMRVLQRQKPKLYDHFETEKLEGEHFILPWAITLWGEMSGDICWILWDGFICQGWKWWVKTLLWLLGILEPQLLKMNFQEMMKCFSELSSGLLNMNINQLKDFGIDFAKAKIQINNIQLHEDLLKDIEKQYKIRVQMVNQYLNKITNPQKRIFR